MNLRTLISVFGMAIIMLFVFTGCDRPYFDSQKCYQVGGDWDEDGYCLRFDCDDFNPEIHPGAPCNDGDSSTHNDVLTDSCTCAGV